MIKDKDGKPLSRSEAEGIMKNRSSVTVSIFAALLALCALIGNQNSSRILNNTLMITDLWGFYQAKSIKKRFASYTRPTGHDTRIERVIANTASVEFVTTATETDMPRSVWHPAAWGVASPGPYAALSLIGAIDAAACKETLENP